MRKNCEFILYTPNNKLPADVQLQLGESTRRYVFKNKPLETTKRQQEIELPEEEEDLDNLTEYNTARNKKIVKMVICFNVLSCFK